MVAKPETNQVPRAVAFNVDTSPKRNYVPRLALRNKNSGWHGYGGAFDVDDSPKTN